MTVATGRTQPGPSSRADRGRTGGPGSLAGTSALAKFALRRDRIMLPAWAYVIVIGVCSNAYTFARLYKTAASRASLATTSNSNPALLFLYGRLNGDSVGALTAWRYGVWAALFAALMTVFLVIRHTRADEEAGRLELIGSAGVGRHAPLAAGLTVAVVANLLVTVLLSIALPLFGLPLAGSIALALAVATCGLAFAGISAVTAQLTASARAARGIAITVLGASFLLRAVGDAAGASGPGWLTWLLPLGWTEALRPFAGERWWALLLPVAIFAAGAALAFMLAARRDLDAGLLPDRPGRPAASTALAGPLSLAWRLQWPALAAWAAGYVILFAVCGAAGKGIGQMVGTSGALRTELTRLGGQSVIVNAYLAGLMLLAGLIAAGYGVAAVLRLRAEESGNLADPVLAGSAGRARWGLSHIMVAVAGMALLLAVGGVATGLGYGLRAGDAGHWVAGMLGGGLAELPATLVIAGVAAAAFGLAARASVAAGWTALGLAVALSLFGPALQLSPWILDASPFTHVPHLPGGRVSVPPLAWMSAIGLGLFAVGLAGLRRRDIGRG
ncbi:MAG TPA: ABC transporter permease [Trebonia sp.]|nr:ABC transporter permease [Trebonia sp.]